MDCETCGEEATIMVERRVQITRLPTYEILANYPEDAYEHDLMTDHFCEKCAREEGYLDGVEENDG